MKNEFVRILEETELKNTKWDLQRYVPHLPVLNQNKPDKVKQTCSTASKFEGASLNDVLSRSRPPIIMHRSYIQIQRFRENQTALTSNVEAMFLQVKVSPAGCKVLRFLWKEATFNLLLCMKSVQLVSTTLCSEPY